MRCLYFADDWNSLLAPGNPQRHANSATRRYSILRNIVGIPPSVYAIPGPVHSPLALALSRSLLFSHDPDQPKGLSEFFYTIFPTLGIIKSKDAF